MIVHTSTELPMDVVLDAFESGFDRLRMVSPKATNPITVARLNRTLAYAVQRQPGNLLAHVQRINLLCSTGSASARIVEAIKALIVTLGENGSSLRNRMLEQVAPLVGADSINVLVNIQPVSDAEPTKIVTPQDYHAAAQPDPLSYADELLCTGDYAEAMTVLESALAKDAANSAIAELLQSIYRSARDTTAYEHTRQSVLNAAPQAASLWPETGAFFGNG
jgi:hypothetical protein